MTCGGGGGGLVDHYPAMLTYLAVTTTYLGYLDQGRARMKEALSEARRLGHAHTLAEVLLQTLVVDATTGSPEMQRHAEELLALSTEHGFPLYLGFATALRGMSLTVLGQGQKGLPLLREGLPAVRATGAVAGTPGILTGLAVAYAMLGQPVEGLRCLTDAAQIIEATEERLSEAMLHRVRAELFNATGNQAAEQSYRQALTVAQRQSAKLFELIAATSLARLWRDQGKGGDARTLLAPIYGWFNEGFDTPVLKEAKTLLEHRGMNKVCKAWSLSDLPDTKKRAAFDLLMTLARREALALPRCQIASWKAEWRSACSPALPHHSMVASVTPACVK
jgi:predicted ATPase